LNTKKLFYKSIIWQAIGFTWISILSFIWFGNWINSLSFSLVTVVVSIFMYVIYEKVWSKFIKK